MWRSIDRARVGGVSPAAPWGRVRSQSGRSIARRSPRSGSELHSGVFHGFPGAPDTPRPTFRGAFTSTMDSGLPSATLNGEGERIVAIHLAWSTRLKDDGTATRAFDALAELCRELLVHHFPPSCGYEANDMSLSGPLEGVQWQITRGRFVADLGLQRFVRAHAQDDPRVVELRLVASCPDRTPSASVDEGLARWNTLLPQLRAQHEVLQNQAQPFPFRAPGPSEAANGSPQARMRHALAVGSSFTWSRAAVLATETTDRPASPSEKTAHTPPRSQDSGT